MKKILAILLVLVLTLGMFTACGGGKEDEGAADATVKIGFAQCNLNDTFQTYVVDAAKAKAAELGYTIDVQDAQEDVVKQQDQVNTMIEQGYDAIMVVPVDTAAMGPITDAVTAAGIPLIYVNRNPFGTDNPPEGVYYVGSQEIVAGQLQGEFLVEKMGEKGGVGILMGILSNEGAVKRTEGNESVLSKYPDIKILAKETGEWQYDKGMAITENWLTAYGDQLNAILANNDGMAIGALQALEAAGRDDVIVVGVDAIPDAVNLVAEGKLDATVLQDADGQGAGAVDVISKILGGAAPEAITWIDFVLVTPDNVADFQ
ncbi:substrate-binding domain-containing protein [Sinanaerobacter chloroacetimidivorans]|jgi:inositol transport system substrate-binding protein|uniref:Substrate-binding domain-containing protein n=1 Tax=Sinanaerobacter chloroacetimidivorans TaxID=2818044 RepID=A0A8J7W7I8_9FIRM|nr:substrate-binding domain-containing protein [Sinanaerobacter chloroacetimidivorans]MBR0600453.1 substrate-binding domain-containing protein [Sinanaerobacter chloroacetimidivorans]